MERSFLAINSHFVLCPPEADKYVVYRIARTSFTGNFEINQAAGIIKLVFAGFEKRIGYNS
jgi:hypothetical protein